MGFLLGRTSRVIGAFSGLQMTEMVAALNAVCRLYGRGLQRSKWLFAEIFNVFLTAKTTH